MDDLDELMREVGSYLHAVDVFRAEGHGPTWLPEPIALCEGAIGPGLAAISTVLALQRKDEHK